MEVPFTASVPETLANVPAVVSFAWATENARAVSASVRFAKSEFALASASLPRTALPLLSIPISCAPLFVISAEDTGASLTPFTITVIIFLINTLPS